MFVPHSKVVIAASQQIWTAVAATENMIVRPERGQHIVAGMNANDDLKSEQKRGKNFLSPFLRRRRNPRSNRESRNVRSDEIPSCANITHVVGCDLDRAAS